MNWQEICDHPSLRNLPFKLETNRWGNIEMSPASNEHGLYQALIIEYLVKYGTNGRAIAECSVQTRSGVKVADVAWASYDFFRRNKRQNPYREAPEVVIEILSPSNSADEMTEKQALYFAQGAQEFWLCGRDGVMAFFAAGRTLDGSRIIGGFPRRIDINFA